MKYLVTGGAGFIGSHIANRLAESGNDVIVLDDLSTGSLDNLNVASMKFVQGTILSPEDVHRAALGCDGIFHTAAVASVQRSLDEPVFCTRVNIEGSVNVLEAAKREGARMVFSSSSAVYGDAPVLPISEDMPTVPISPYGVHKLTVEQLLRSYHAAFNLEANCLRYFNVYGPKQDPNGEYAAVISKFVTRALRGDDLVIFGDGAQTRDFIYVEDVVDANIAAMQAPQADGAAYNIGFGKAWSVRELAELIRSSTNSNSMIRCVEPRAGEILHSFGSVDRAASQLNFRATTTMTEGLQLVAEYWQNKLAAKTT